MPDRRNRLPAHQFVLRRVVSALVVGETDPDQAPFRRLAGALLAGVMVAAVALAGVGMYGAVAHSDGGWRVEGTIVAERETGARYVFLRGRLHPVANYASALLLAGAPGAEVVMVSRAALAGVARGRPLGIPGAPDSLPPPGRLLTGGWTLCSRPDPDAAGRPKARSVLFVGAPAGTGHPLGDDAFIAVDGRTQHYLVWHGHRYRLVDPAHATAVLGQLPVVAVATSWLAGLPSGVDIGPVVVAGRGRRSALLRSARVGEVFVVRVGGTRQYHLLTAAGLAALTPLQAYVTLADPATYAPTGDATPLPLGTYSALPHAAPLGGSPGDAAAPGDVPPPAPVPAPDRAVCSAFAGDAGAPTVLDDVGIPSVDAAAWTPGWSRDGGYLADRIWVAPGRAALVTGLPAPDAPAGTPSLVTDIGVRYAIMDRAALAALGYAHATPVGLPAALVALVPAGPPLDPDAARAAIPPTGRPGPWN